MKNFDFTTLKALAIPEGDVIKIERGNEILWEKAAEFKNLLPLATDTDRKTIYQGKGFITGYRLSSSGGVTKLDGMCASGFIFPCKPGDVLRIKGIKAKKGTASYVITYDSSNTKVAHGNLAHTQDGSVWLPSDNAYGNVWQEYDSNSDILTITLSSDVFGTNFDALRFSAGVIDENTIVTINQEIPV